MSPKPTPSVPNLHQQLSSMANVLSTEGCISTAAALKPPKKSLLARPQKKELSDGWPRADPGLPAQGRQTHGGGVRRTLRAMGYLPARISQLLSECRQYPPRNHTQRPRQTLQDQPQCIDDDSDRIKLNSTNDAQSIILILS